MHFKRALIILLVLSVFGCSKEQQPISDGSLSGGEGEWVIKIDKLTVKEDKFKRDLKAFMQLNGQTEDQINIAQNDNATKQAYAEKIINDVLLLQKAENEKFFESDEAKAIIDSALRNIKVQYYTQKIMADASKNIPEPTEDQARAFFDQAKGQIAQMYGITEFNTQTRPAINQLYKLAFAEQMVQRDVSDLKDKAVIERNTTVLGAATLLPGANNPANIQQPGQELLPRTTSNQ